VQPAPAEKPPAETPPAEKPSAETPSAEKPPAETPPAEPPPKPAKKAAPVAPAVPGLRAPPEDVLRAQKEIALPAGILRDDDGRLWREKDGAELVLVPAGEFLMGRAPGAGDEMPAHRVAVSAFLLDRHEVTLGQFRRFSAAAGHPVAAQRPESTDAHPVVNVVWEDARAYAAWVAGRLPTEAEFEKALRGGLPGTTYPWGDEGRPHGKPGNYVDMSARSGGGALLRTVIEGYDDGFAGLAPAGALEPNAYGLFDVTGNAWEWCSDFYDPRYYGTLGKEVARDPPGPAAGSASVARGGAWSSNVQFLRCAYRNRMDPTARNDGLGFRVARGVP